MAGSHTYSAFPQSTGATQWHRRYITSPSSSKAAFMEGFCPMVRTIIEVICTTHNEHRYRKVHNYEVHNSKAHTRMAYSSHAQSLPFWDTNLTTPSACQIPRLHYQFQGINCPPHKIPPQPRCDISRIASPSSQPAPYPQFQTQVGVLHHPTNVH